MTAVVERVGSVEATLPPSEFTRERAIYLRLGFETLMRMSDIRVVQCRKRENREDNPYDEADVVLVTYGNISERFPHDPYNNPIHEALMEEALLKEEAYGGEVDGVEQAQRRVFSWQLACDAMHEAGLSDWDDHLDLAGSKVGSDEQALAA